jgi:hypothetical protein
MAALGSIHTMTAKQELAALQLALQQLRQGQLKVDQLATQAHSLQRLPAELPARFATVLHELLNRLESSALFSEESCSFSQVDLLDSLQMWLDKAGVQLSKED